MTAAMQRKHTDEELKKIAVDMYAGHIFSDRQCPDVESLRRIFPILNFMDEKAIADVKKEEYVFCFEYMNESRGTINGMPMFFSLRFLNQEDFDVMWGFYSRLTKAIKEL